MSNHTPNLLLPPPASLWKPFMTPPMKLKPVTLTAAMENVSVVKPGSLEWGLGITGFTINKAHDFCRYAGRKTFNQLRVFPYSNIWHITEEILGLTQSHSMKVIKLRAWYMDWTTKPADTHRVKDLKLTKESFNKFLGEVNIKDLEQQEAQPSAPLSDTTKQKLTTLPLTCLRKTKLATLKWIQGTYPHSQRRGMLQTPFSNGIICSAAKCS